MNRKFLSICAISILLACRVAAQPPEPTISKSTYYQSIEYSNADLEKSLPPKVIILLDSSGSMGQLMDKQKSKMFYAKKLFGSYLADQWREKAEVGLLVYGSRRKHDCSDFFMAVPFSEKSLPKIDNAVKVLERRYLSKDETGKLKEDPQGMFKRVAKAIAAADASAGRPRVASPAPRGQ